MTALPAAGRINGRTLLQCMVIGSLANLLVLTSLILILYAGFAVVAVFYSLVDNLAHARVEGTPLGDQSFWQLAGTSLLTSVRNGWQGLINARFAYLAFACLGLFAAAGWFFGGHMAPARRWWFSFAAMTAVLAFAAVAWMVLQRSGIQLWIAESPELFRWRHVLMRSLPTDISVILIFSLLVSIPVWMGWRWWFERLALRRQRHRPKATAMPSALAEHRALRNVLQERHTGTSAPVPHTPPPPDPYTALLVSRTFLVPALLVFLGLGITIAFINMQYKTSSLRLEHDAFVLSPRDTHRQIPLAIAEDGHKIRIVNINGEGTVSVGLYASDALQEPIAAVRDWSFTRRSEQEYFYQEFPLANIPADQYQLDFQQIEGWGWYEYTLSQGSADSGATLSLVLGIAIASAIMLGGVLLLSGVLALKRT